MEYSGPTIQYHLRTRVCRTIRMFRITTCVVLVCILSSGHAFPFAAAPSPGIPPVVAPVSPIVPTAYPYANARPLVPGVAGYRNPLVSDVSRYNNPLVPGVLGYNNPYNNQFSRTPGAAIPILTYSSEHIGDGTYSFSFTTADGKQAQEAGYLKDAYIDNVGEPQGTQVVQGSYAYISPEGTPIQVTYVADENGFRPSGVHIPADSKAVIPGIDKERQILDPLYNRQDGFDYRNRYNLGSINRPYDPRYPYDATKYNYNNLYNNQYLAPGLTKDKNTKKNT